MRALKVISQGGVAPYRGTNVSADSIARALSAGTIVRGTVEPDGDKFQIRVRLIDGNSGDQVAEQSFEQSSGNVVVAQDSVAVKVAEMLRQRIGSEVAIREARAGTTNAAAWTLFQRAQRLRKDADIAVSAANPAGAEKNFAAADSLLAAASQMDASWSEPLVARSSIAFARARATDSPIEARPFIDNGLKIAAQVLAKQPRDAAALEMQGSLRYLKWAYSLAANPSERTALLDGAEAEGQRALARAA